MFIKILDLSYNFGLKIDIGKPFQEKTDIKT